MSRAARRDPVLAPVRRATFLAGAHDRERIKARTGERKDTRKSPVRRFLPSVPMANRSNASLIGASALGALLCLLVLKFRRTSGASREPGRPAREVAGPASASVLAPAAASPIDSDSQRVALGDVPPAEQAADAVTSSHTLPATVTGRVRLYGSPPDGGKCVLRSADGTFERSAALDLEGRFRFGTVPGAKLELSFELQSTDARQLLLPSVEVAPAAGAVQELDLDWEPRHVNVRVLGDGPGGNRARLEVEGPRTRANLDTDEVGKARLSVVGQGLFTFRAVQPCGRQGATTLELEEGAGLDSVVITAKLPAER